MVSVGEGFPDAAYLVLASRLIPGVDGGYTVATLQRALLLAASGVEQGRGPVLLTVDPGTPGDHAEHRAEFAARGLITGTDRMRNLFDEAAAPGGGAASWLRDAATPGAPDPDLQYRTVADAAGRSVLDLPVLAGPDWHASTAPVVLRDGMGAVAGVIPGFGALYRAWLDRVVAGIRADRPGVPIVLVCESRQLGELIAGWRPPGVRLVHTVHTIHLEPPYTPDAPVNPLWRRWLAASAGFDAVLGLVSVPLLTTVPYPAIQFRYRGTGDRALRMLMPDQTTWTEFLPSAVYKTARMCVPASFEGTVPWLSIRPNSTGSCTTAPTDYWLDDLAVVNDPTCL